MGQQESGRPDGAAIRHEDHLSIVVSKTQISFPETKRIDPQDVLRDFFRSRSKHTLRAYEQDLSALAVFLGIVGPQDERHAAAIEHLCKLSRIEANIRVGEWMHAMEDQQLSRATRARRLGSLMQLLRVARRVGFVEWTVDVERPKGPKVRNAKGPGVLVVAQMVEVCSADLPGLRDRGLLALLGSLGLRRDEAARLRLHNYDRENLLLSFFGKRQREFTFDLRDNPHVAADLNAWIDAAGIVEPDAPLITSFDRLHPGKLGGPLTGAGIFAIVRRLAEKAGVDVKKVRPHGLRHTAGSTVYHRTGSLVATQAFLRHQSVTTTMNYIDDDRSAQASAAASLVADAIYGKHAEAVDPVREALRAVLGRDPKPEELRAAKAVMFTEKNRP